VEESKAVLFTIGNTRGQFVIVHALRGGFPTDKHKRARTRRREAANAGALCQDELACWSGGAGRALAGAQGQCAEAQCAQAKRGIGRRLRGRGNVMQQKGVCVWCTTGSVSSGA